MNNLIFLSILEILINYNFISFKLSLMRDFNILLLNIYIYIYKTGFGIKILQGYFE